MTDKLKVHPTHVEASTPEGVHAWLDANHPTDKHTPGPWKACDPMCKSIVVAFGGTEKQIVIARLGTEARLATTANAALIASAPTLKLERGALKQTLLNTVCQLEKAHTVICELASEAGCHSRTKAENSFKICEARALLAAMEGK